MRDYRRLAVLLLLVFLVAFRPAQQASVTPPPSTPKHPVLDVYHGVKVSDDYRWLEDGNDPSVKRWSDAQNQRSREYLDHLASRLLIKDRLRQLLSGSSGHYYALEYIAGTVFAMKAQPPKQQPMLVAMKAEDFANEKVIVDPNVISENGTTAIDFFSPSLDGKLVAVSLSENGTEDGTEHVFEVATGKELPDRVPRVNGGTAGGSVAWKADGTGFYYTRYPQGKERPKQDLDFYQQVYFHKLGTESRQDSFVLGKDFPRIAEIQLHTDREGHYLLASVANGDGGQFAHYLMGPSGRWTQVTRFEDGVVFATPGQDQFLYLLSRKGAPRGRILRVLLADPELAKAEVVVPESEASPGSGDGERASIQNVLAARNKLYVVDVVGGPTQVRLFDVTTDDRSPNGSSIRVRAEGKLPQAPVSSIKQVVPLDGDDVLFRVSGYLDPPGWYLFHAGTGKATRTTMVTTSSVEFGDAEVVREFAISKDGTRVPLNIIRRKELPLDGNNPTLLEGYGGFGISLEPGFIGPFGRIWLDAGGVLVIANLRGGGEYGEEWHEAGKLTKKQNVFDDFIACAEYLIQHKYTSPAHLAIIGGSNGGLLMGAALTQHPELFHAVVSFVGVYDMLRVELDPNGTFNTTEYGSTRDLEQFQALYAYSPYHHVKDGAAYPAILFLTGSNDKRVNPYHSRKMIARLQTANASNHPILLRTSPNTGHGYGTALNEEIEQHADLFSFLFDQLGLVYPPSQAARRGATQ